MVRRVYIINESTLTFRQIGAIIDRQTKALRQHLNEPIMLDCEDGSALWFVLEIQKQKNYEVWKFTGVTA